MNVLIGLWVQVLTACRNGRWRRDEAGQAVSEYLGLAALGVAAIVVIGGAMRLLGLDVVNWMRTQLGV